MDNVRADFFSVLVNIVHVKLFSQQCIPLYGDHGILFAVYIFGVDIYLGAVEGGFSHILHKRNIQFH